MQRGCNRYAAYPCHVPGISECLHLGNSYAVSVYVWYRFLVAPIYKATKADAEGNDIRDGIYLPEGEWIDYFTGEKYQGNCVLNNFAAPLWKLPVFVKNGAIIPMTNPNNNVAEINKGLRIYEIYPYKHMMTVEYDDDGISEAYKEGKGTTTFIESNVDSKNNVKISIRPTQG